jgi:ABC-type branched-subunit amino acid transport system permease subunit
VGYDFALIGLALVTGISLWFGLNRTITGKIVLAVIHDRDISRAMGVNVTRVFAFAFTLGVFLAALGGAFTAPKISVQPGIGITVILLSFAIVVIGGLGSVEGAAIAALFVGFARAAAIHLMPWAGALHCLSCHGAGAGVAARGAVPAHSGAENLMAGIGTLVAALVAFAVLALLGYAAPNWFVLLGTLAFAKGLVVLGIVALMRGGLVSFGQGTFYCAGAYAAGMAMRSLGIGDAAILVALGGSLVLRFGPTGTKSARTPAEKLE